MRDALVWIDRQLGHLAGLFALTGALGILALLGITVAAVFWRYALNAPIFGIEDVSVVALTVVAAAAVSFGARKDAHVSINLITYFFGRRVTRYTDALMRALVAGISFLATYALITKACGMAKACITSNLAIEHQPFYYVLAVAMGFYGLFMTVQLLQGLLHWSDAHDPNEVQD